jgi:hypothetical protein
MDYLLEDFRKYSTSLGITFQSLLSEVYLTEGLE